MDKVSAVLIIGIIGAVMLSGIIVYDTWMADEDTAYEVLIFNDDTSITNNSDSHLWIRAKLDEETASKEAEILQNCINDGFWIDGEDGWHYYVRRIGFAQATSPFIDNVKYDAEQGLSEQGGRNFGLDVEAIDQQWLLETPVSCREAFLMFKNNEQKALPIYL